MSDRQNVGDIRASHATGFFVGAAGEYHFPNNMLTNFLITNIVYVIMNKKC